MDSRVEKEDAPLAVDHIVPNPEAPAAKPMGANAVQHATDADVSTLHQPEPTPPNADVHPSSDQQAEAAPQLNGLDVQISMN